MTEMHDVAIDEVRTLVAERQRYDDWLTALDARRADTPARVFDRVYGDYEGRRSAVLEKLREHVDTLEGLGHSLESRLKELDDQLLGHEDERAEAILRTAVGEYDGERWESVRQDVEARIAALSEQRGSVHGEAEEVRSLLSSARVQPAVIVEAEVVEPEVVEAEVVEAEVVEPEVVEPEVVALEPVNALMVDAEPEVRSTHIVEAPVPAMEQVAVPAAVPVASPIDAAAPAASAAPIDDLDGSDFDDALALFSTEPHSAPFDPALSATSMNAPANPASSGSRQVYRPDVPPKAAEAPFSAPRDAFDDLAFLRSVTNSAAPAGAARSTTTSEQQKTLRCTECGTMNFPTEWYCERCGGELAAF